MYESGPAPSSFPAVAFAKFGRKLSKFLLPKYKLLFYMMFYRFSNSRHQKQPPPKVMVCKFMGVDSFAAHYSARP